LTCRDVTQNPDRFAKLVSPDQWSFKVQIDQQMLSAVIRQLRLARPVDVVWEPLPPGITGSYQTDKFQEQNRHVISLTNQAPGCCEKHARIPADELTETLLHELQHAEQAERGDLPGRYARFQRQVGYDRNPLEREADWFADVNQARFAGLVFGPDLVSPVEILGVRDWMIALGRR
jgi:hypothetical protein